MFLSVPVFSRSHCPLSCRIVPFRSSILPATFSIVMSYCSFPFQYSPGHILHCLVLFHSLPGILPATFSIVMSYTSGIMVLGNTAEQYTYGVQQWWGSVGNAIAYTAGAFIFVPLFFPLKLTSSFEVRNALTISNAQHVYFIWVHVLTGHCLARVDIWNLRTSLKPLRYHTRSPQMVAICIFRYTIWNRKTIHATIH